MTEQLMLFPPAFPVSLSALPEKDRAVQMTVTSGLICSELLTRSDPLGLLVKMLLVSPAWYTQKTLLEWRTKELFGWKIKSTTADNDILSIPSARILNTWDIPSSRLSFQLAPWVPGTDEIVFGFWPTPMAGDVRGTSTDWAMKKRTYLRNYIHGSRLAIYPKSRDYSYPNPDLYGYLMGYPSRWLENK
ncbi:hypothetical protein [Chitinophaga sp. 212800010-3]|uniref:hypothetical protein n=1 Tax=unclassified Chitinophaga TaxID=2619133 RepID=UPI002E14E9E1